VGQRDKIRAVKEFGGRSQRLAASSYFQAAFAAALSSAQAQSSHGINA
jgi:hypothetical protein